MKLFQILLYKKYAEFEEKFSTELESIDGLQEQINKLKNYMSSIANNKTETQEKIYRNDA